MLTSRKKGDQNVRIYMRSVIYLQYLFNYDHKQSVKGKERA